MAPRVSMRALFLHMHPGGFLLLLSNVSLVFSRLFFPSLLASYPLPVLFFLRSTVSLVFSLVLFSRCCAMASLPFPARAVFLQGHASARVSQRANVRPTQVREQILALFYPRPSPGKRCVSCKCLTFSWRLRLVWQGSINVKWRYVTEGKLARWALCLPCHHLTWGEAFALLLLRLALFQSLAQPVAQDGRARNRHCWPNRG